MRTFFMGLVGYFVFALSAVVLFQSTGVDPHDAPTWSFLLGSVLYGLLFALAAGWLATRWARGLQGAGVVAALMALSGVMSIAARPGAGAIWSQLVTIFVFAPAALAGGSFGRVRRPQ